MIFFEMDQQQFIETSAEDLIRNLSEEDKAALLQNPEYTDHHFGLGMYIRNHYIYTNQDLRLPAVMADGLSHKIFDQAISILKIKAENQQSEEEEGV